MFVYMVLACLLYFGHYCYFSKQITWLPYTDVIYSFCNLSVYPAYYLYIQKITTNLPLRPHLLWLFAPATLVALSNLGGYHLQSPELVQTFLHQFLYQERFFSPAPITEYWLTTTHRLSTFIFAIQVFWVVGGSMLLIHRFEHRLRDFYADVEYRDMTLTRRLIVSVFLISILASVVNLLGKSFFIPHNLLLGIPSLIFSTLIYLLGYDGYHRTFTEAVFARERAEAQPELEEKDAALPAPDDCSNELNLISEATHCTPATSTSEPPYGEIAERLIHTLIHDQLYLRPDLKISDLIPLLGINRAYLYYALTRKLNTSFCELINRLRIEHACLLMHEHMDYTNKDLAKKVGYQNEMSFYRNFKKITMLTPQQWRRGEKNDFTLQFLRIC